MWGSGNYAAVAEKIGMVGEHVVEAVGLAPGMEILDVACGAGNATIPARPLGRAGDWARLLSPTCSRSRGSGRPTRWSRSSGSRATPRSSRSPMRASTA